MLSEKKFDILYKYDNPINWNITGFGNDIMTYILLKYIRYTKDLGLENPIKTIHGSYISKYNGGRLALFIRPNYYIYDKIREINSLGVGVKLTFSNPYITKEVFEEKELNEYLEVLSENKDVNNGIICSVDDFADFIHQKYPSIEVTSSYVKMAIENKIGKTDNVEYYNNLFDKYDKVVVNTAKAFDDEFIDQIKYKDRIEFIVNNTCNLNCPIAHKHYEAMYELSQSTRYLFENNIIKTDPKIELARRKLKAINEDCKKRRLQVNVDNMKYQQLNRDEINILSNKGIINFKIEGRDLDFILFRGTLFRYIYVNDSIFELYPLMPDNNQLNDFYAHKIIEN